MGMRQSLISWVTGKFRTIPNLTGNRVNQDLKPKESRIRLPGLRFRYRIHDKVI